MNNNNKNFLNLPLGPFSPGGPENKTQYKLAIPQHVSCLKYRNSQPYNYFTQKWLFTQICIKILNKKDLYET